MIIFVVSDNSLFGRSTPWQVNLLHVLEFYMQYIIAIVIYNLLPIYATKLNCSGKVAVYIVLYLTFKSYFSDGSGLILGFHKALMTPFFV